MSNTENLNRRGRKPGSKNTVAFNKTKIFQSCFTEDDVARIADTLKERMFDPDVSTRDLTSLFSSVAKLLFVTPDALVEAEAVSTVNSKADADKLRDAIREKMKSL